MGKTVASRGRIASVSNAGGMVTGVVEPSWSSIASENNGMILEIGVPEKKFGMYEDSWKYICSYLGIENTSKQTIDISDKGSLRCPLNETSDKNSNTSEWYELGSIEEKLPETLELLILNRVERPVSHDGILENVDLIKKSSMLAITGVENPQQHGLALKIAEKCRGFIRLDEIEIGNGKKNTVAIIEPAKDIKTPSPLPYPSIARILPKRLELAHPVGVANDYFHISEIAQSNTHSWEPKIPISVVIPLYNRKEMLGRTLAMITHQTYPLNLIEVVVADDGSSDDPLTIIKEFEKTLDIQYVRQRDEGYRLSEVRNLGIRSSKNDYIILLDCDMAPIPTMIEAYSRRMELSTRALYCGHRRYVDANHISLDEVRRNPNVMLSLPDIETINEKMKRDGHILDWRMPMYRQTDNLRFEKYPFRAVCGGNIGFHKSLFERAGEFDESFRAWGKEDTEWGFRVWNKGDYIIPLYEACGMHMEPPGGRNETDRELGLEEVMPIFVDRVPVMYRKHEHGVCHSVPLVSIYIPAYNAEDSIVETVNSALDQTFQDIEVCIAVDGAKDGTLSQLEKNFLSNPRVRWVHQDNQGIGGASNTAVQMCRGAFIGQLDSDDLLLPEAVEIMLEEIQKDTRIGVVYGSFQKETPEGEFLEDGYEWPDYSREKLMHGCIVHHFRMFRARDWWRTEGFASDIRNAVDFDMFLKLSEVTEMRHVNEWTYVYRIHDGSTSVSRRDEQIRNHFVCIERSLSRRGLADRWEATPSDKLNRTQVRFVEKRDWDKQRDTTTPFARMEARMREATPLIVRHLAKMEATKRPWTISSFPLERFNERVKALSRKMGINEKHPSLLEILNRPHYDLWSALDDLQSISDHNLDQGN